MRPFMPTLTFGSRDRLARHLLILTAFIVFLVVITIAFSLVFQYMMVRYEEEEHSFVNALYWTITTMSTLGFGDITFVSHAGRLYSGLVTVAGLFLLGILLPFGVIAVAFGPWLERQLRYRPPTKVSRKLSGHVIICGWDSVTETLAKRLRATGIPYTAIVPDPDEVKRLEEEGVSVISGRPTDAEVLRRTRTEYARMVIANTSDPDNVNLALTATSVAETPIAAVVTDPNRSDLMTVAGADHVVPLREMLGNYLAVRATTKGAMGHVVDSLGELLFAEVASHGTPFVGKTLRETEIRQKTGASVIGMWERGVFTLPTPDTRIAEGMVMLLVGTVANLEALEQIIGDDSTDDLVIVAGYGTVGSASANALRRRGVQCVVIDREADIPDGQQGFMLGDASRREVLERAGIMEAGGLIVTTNDDGINVFLTLAARHLNPLIRIVARSNLEENVAELYAAGADFVVSHSSVGASILANMIEGRQTVFLTEGVHIFWRTVPALLSGHTISGSHLRSVTGATVVAIQKDSSETILDLSPDTVLEQGATMILVGTPESEELFSQRFGGGKRRLRLRRT